MYDFGVSEQVKLEPACLTTKTSEVIKIQIKKYAMKQLDGSILLNYFDSLPYISWSCVL